MGKARTGNISNFHVPRERATKRGIIRSALVKLYLTVHRSSLWWKDMLINLTRVRYCPWMKVKTDQYTREKNKQWNTGYLNHTFHQNRRKRRKVQPKGTARKGCGACVKNTREKNKKDTAARIAKGKTNKPKARQTHRLRPVYVYPIPKKLEAKSVSARLVVHHVVVIYRRKGRSSEKKCRVGQLSSNRRHGRRRA
jgi:hypothetical protein